jgi:hypothetical protein
MPIRINLLAEAQELEELRRRDPVKRVIMVGVGLVLVLLAYSSSLLFKTMMTKSEVTRLEGNLNSLTNEYRQILQSQNNLVETKQKLQSLERLAANRFLMGNLLNALQKTTSENVQLVRLKLDQTYTLVDEVKAKGTGSKATAAKPATAREKITLTLSAKDKSPTPGDGVSKFQGVLSSEGYFKTALGGTNGFRLVSMSPTQTDADGRAFLLMTLEGRFPEKTR